MKVELGSRMLMLFFVILEVYTAEDVRLDSAWLSFLTLCFLEGEDQTYLATQTQKISEGRPQHTSSCYPEGLALLLSGRAAE